MKKKVSFLMGIRLELHLLNRFKMSKNKKCQINLTWFANVNMKK